MGRPKFLQCIMTPKIIRNIRERQEIYDRDPEAYERRQKEIEDYQRQESEELENIRKQKEAREQERQWENNLPF